MKTEISELRNELRRFITNANRQHIDSVLEELKGTYSDLFRNQQVETARGDLSTHMVANCTMRENCFGVFMEFLQNTARHIRDGNVSDEIIRSYREELKNLRSKGPSDRCDTCFSEVIRLFEQQVGLMESLGIYNKIEGNGDTHQIDEEKAVRMILEPVANIQRFQILKSLTTETRTFSEISQMTGLRGGNLLFHIKKLTDSGMIFQRHERGDYLITRKGYRTIEVISGLVEEVH
nr:winged helix-turn-helix domain-containing protein [Methanocalculus chunghsingensis]